MTTAPEASIPNLPSQYDPTDAEARWQRLWESQGAFKANVESDRLVSYVEIPLPIVTVSLQRVIDFTRKNCIMKIDCKR